MTKKYGFVYIWFDRKHKRYYVGCHWGTIEDGYVCSSSWMKQAYLHRPNDFKRKILKTNILKRPDMYIEEQRYLDMIKINEIKPINNHPRYYNLCLKNNKLWHAYEEQSLTVGEKIRASKLGKPITFKDPEARAAKISATKRKNLDKKFNETGSFFTKEHLEKMSTNRLGSKHTEEWKMQHSDRLKKSWSDPEKAKIRKENARLAQIEYWKTHTRKKG